MTLQLAHGRVALGARDLAPEGEDSRRLFLLLQWVIPQAIAADRVVDLVWDHVDLAALPPKFTAPAPAIYTSVAKAPKPTP